MLNCIQSGGLTDKIDNRTAYTAIAKAGFEGIDWNGPEHVLTSEKIRSLDYRGQCIFEKSLDEVMAYFAEELELIREVGLAIPQCHAAFPAYVPGHPELLDYMIGIYIRTIEFCQQIGCGNVIIHGISLYPDDRENTFETIDALNRKLYGSLIPVLQKCTDVTVCIENLCRRFDDAISAGICSDPYEAVNLIDSLNEQAGREAFGLCLDTGHLQLVKKDMRAYIPVLGKRIKALHIHDNDGFADMHMAPMTGKFDWLEFCEALREIGYTGDLGFEIYRQVYKAFDVDIALLHPWLELVKNIGQVFRDKIQN